MSPAHGNNHWGHFPAGMPEPADRISTALNPSTLRRIGMIFASGQRDRNGNHPGIGPSDRDGDALPIRQRRGQRRQTCQLHGLNLQARVEILWQGRSRRRHCKRALRWMPDNGRIHVHILRRWIDNHVGWVVDVLWASVHLNLEMRRAAGGLRQKLKELVRA